ncbi:MAG: UDP-3-O-(3-hydroxymyristoyl)glucosamine N-acyltransferase [Prosthecobacter sp.]|nr:UDP-3-O-(3-hydroxymyristoyl)glucosamine N-acyltransferase [Prosthecobacter sp.]
MDIALSELAELLGGQLLTGSLDTRVTGFASLKEARAGDLSFFYDARYRERLAETQATAVLVPAGWDNYPDKVACIGVEDPSRAFEKVVDTYGFHAAAFEPGIHPSAVIAEGVKADLSKISVAACAVIDSGAQIGDGAEIGAGCYVGRDAIIGAGSKLFPNVTIQEACEIGERVILHSSVVIGADGFGYEFEKGRHRKVRQAGIVQIDNDVEIGAGTMVDRARFGRTWIGEGTKIDNLVQIGHNVVIGKHCIIVSGTAIAGSAIIGDYVVMAAQCGVAGHVSVGSFVTLGGRSGVTKDIPTGKATYMGFPAMPVMDERRRLASINRLPHLSARVKALESDQTDSTEPNG